MTRNSKPLAQPGTVDYEGAVRCAEPVIRQACVESGMPGLAVGIFGPHGKIIDKHFGHYDLEKPNAPDQNTIFNIGSMCKGFTALAVACLVADGKVHWDDSIDNFLTELSDMPNGRFTIRDLLSHRTGLCRSDSLFIGSDNQLLVTKAQGFDIFTSLDAPRPIRQDFVYNNLGYHAVGCVIERVSCYPYGEFLRRRIFQPLGMDRTYTRAAPETEKNVAKAYIPYQSLKLRQIPLPSISEDTIAFAAGSIRSCLHDLILFYGALLRRLTAVLPGAVFDELEIASDELRTLFQGTMPIQNPDSMREQSYGLGWARTQLPNQLSELSGNAGLLGSFPVIGNTTRSPLLLHHGGNNMGCSSSVYLIPELNTGILALGNALGHCDATDWAAQILIEAILQGTLTTPFQQYVSKAAHTGRTAMDRVQAKLDEEKAVSCPPSDLQRYTGTFWHKTRQFRIVSSLHKIADDESLRISFQGNDKETYTLRHYHHDVFVFNETFDCLIDRGQWCRPYWFYKIQFCSSGSSIDSIDSIRWRIDDTQEEGQHFTKAA